MTARTLVAALPRLRAHLRTPLHRNAYALVLSSAVTSGLGLLYWILATNLYSPAAVGVSAAVISAMTLIANLAQLNLKGALNRFLPRAGAASARFVLDAYLIAGILAATAGAVFLAGIDLWTPDLGFLADRPELAVCFVLATVAWGVFVLQDAVLAGLREAVWVPVENGAYAVAKIVLLVALAGAMPVLGIFASWTLPLLAVVLPINLLIFRRLLPRHVRATQAAEQPPAAREVRRYVAADYTAYLVWAATIDVLPLIVLGLFGAEANAHFFLSWTIAYGLYLVSSGMGVAMITEGALEPARLAEHRRRTIIESARLVVPCAIAVALAAPFILSLLGDSYSRDAVTLLRLLSLSAIPFVVVAAYANAARVERRMRRVVAIYAALAGSVLGGGLALSGPLGVDAFGVSWLVGQSVVAVALGGTGALGAARTALGARLSGLPGVRRTLNEMHTAPIVAGDGGPLLFVKRATGSLGDRSLVREARVLRAVRADRRVAGWAQLVPAVVAVDRPGGRTRLVTTALSGTPIDRLPASRRDDALARAAETIAALHRATVASVHVGEAELTRWVDRPLELVRAALAGRRESIAHVDVLRAELRRELGGATVRAAWIHGDFSAGNVLVGSDGEITGVVDWEAARPRALPQLDLVQLELSAARDATGLELGELVRRELAGQGPPGPAWAAPAEGCLSRRTLVLLTWLHHVAGNLAKSGRYARSRRWRADNVEAVLGWFVEPATPAAASVPVSAGPSAMARSRPRGATLARLAVPLTALGAGLLAWAAALPGIEPREMTRFGLVSVLPPAFLVSLAALTVGFAVVVARRHVSTPMAAAYIVTLAAVLHATPPLVYDALRYSWAWKHLGIVDYIQRTGGVSPDIAYLDVYHSWPGFFVLAAVLADLGGIGDLSRVAAWAPLAFNLMSVGALAAIISSLTRDRRIVWLGAWLFLLMNWIGQDYFSPQALAFTMYLAVLAIVLRLLAPEGLGAAQGGPHRLPVRLGALLEGLPRAGAPAPSRATRAAAITLVLVLMAAIAATHALTSVMMAVALTALVLVRRCAIRSLPLAAAGMVLVWGLTFASSFVSRNVGDALSSVRLPWVTADATLSSSIQLSSEQTLTATVGRLMVVAAVVLAVIGMARQAYRGPVESAALVLAVAPVALFGLGDYDGEVLFRVALFSVPFLAFFAAYAMPGVGSAGVRRAAGVAGVSVVLAAGFLVAAYGNDRGYHFTSEEVAATRWLYATAPAGALIIDGTRNYPAQWSGYERYRYVTISREDPDSQAPLLADPARVLDRWMTDPRDRGAYLIITQGQKAEEDGYGALPRGSLDRIERALGTSPRFRVVYRNRDAVIFTSAARR